MENDSVWLTAECLCADFLSCRSNKITGLIRKGSAAADDARVCRYRSSHDSSLERNGFELCVPRYPWWSPGSPRRAIGQRRQVTSEFVSTHCNQQARAACDQLVKRTDQVCNEISFAKSGSISTNVDAPYAPAGYARSIQADAGRLIGRNVPPAIS